MIGESLCRVPLSAESGVRRPLEMYTTELDEPSPYFLGEDINREFVHQLSNYEFDRIFLVSSRELRKLLAGPLLAELLGAGIPVQAIDIQEGESAKTWSTLAGLCDALVEGGVTRKSLIVAFGGGVIGNIVGLAAGLIYRGLRFIELPTTLMAQTDSVLSNKQAINGVLGKNQFGLYHAPLFVWADIAYLRTEPLRQIRGAIVEGVKNGLIHDAKWLARLAERLRSGKDLRLDMLGLVRSLIESKLAILREDPSERGSAVILEYGHTFGHAIEWLSRGRLIHGEAVAMGMVMAARLSRLLGLLDEDQVAYHRELLEGLLGMPGQLPAEITPDDVYRAMLADNKRSGPQLTCLLLEEIGKPFQREGSYLVPVGQRETLLAIAGA